MSSELRFWLTIGKQQRSYFSDHGPRSGQQRRTAGQGDASTEKACKPACRRATRAIPAYTFLGRDRQRQQFGTELQELEYQIEASTGYRFYNRMNLLEKSYFIFDLNHLNLKHILDEFEQPMVFLKLWEEKNRDRFDLFINDVIRLFHNYFAGSRTLLGHVHALQNDMFRGIDFSDEYQTRWDQQFGGSSLPQFV